jgi:hypothetical protein
MATYNVARAKHATLVVSTVDTVNFSDVGQHTIIVSNKSTGQALYFRLDGTDPTADGDECYLAVPSGRKVVKQRVSITAVKLISGGAQIYSVELMEDGA